MEEKGCVWCTSYAPKLPCPVGKQGALASLGVSFLAMGEGGGTPTPSELLGVLYLQHPPVFSQEQSLLTFDKEETPREAVTCLRPHS